MLSWDVRYFKKIERAEGTKSFRFERPDDFNYLPGQFFIITIPQDDGQKLTHHFSFSSSPSEPFIEFTTRMRDSDFKNTMDNLLEGTAVTIMESQGVFTLGEKMDRVAYICGGIGVTPARSTIRWAVDTDAGIDIVLLYANRTLKSTAFREEFDSLKDRHIKVVYILSRPEEEWKGLKGHINADMINDQVPDWNKRIFYVSGPPGLVDAIRNVLLDEVGVSSDQLKVENFTGY